MDDAFAKVLKEMGDLYRNAPCGYHSLDGNGLFLEINDTELEWLGYSREEVVGKFKVTDIVFPEDRPKSMRAFECLLREGEVRDLEVRLMRKDGSALPVLVNANSLRDEEGNFLMSRSMVTDISGQKKAERAFQALLESEGKCKSVIMAMTGGILLLDLAGRITNCNPNAERILGISMAKSIGKSFAELELRIVSENGAPFSVVNFPAAGEIRRNVVMGVKKASGTSWISVDSETLSYDGAPFATMISFSDISESKRQREKLHRSYCALRELSFRLHHVREAERTSIAREIHDELGSTLTSLKFDLSWAADKNGNRKEFETILKDLDAAINNVKRICTALRPSILDDLGLLAAVEWQTGEFTRKTGIRCRIETKGREPSVPQDVATGIFRIFQETLTNIARHADAANVLVEFHANRSNLRLTVTDDGKGIDPKKATASKSIGILGMSERAQALGGALSVRPGLSGGTQVALSIPTERRASKRSSASSKT